ncbi:MAG: ribonuclease III [Ruminococcaceae bacterium]|nr:ribonuclease III [Oscillospiraceae bacterium]
MDIKQFQKNIGYFFKNPDILKTAFTHTSYANEHNIQSYERLEFLGDAIVDFLVGEYLFTNFPTLNEGMMSRIRATLVCEKTLSELALELSINECMLLGNGASQSGERNRPSILSDMFEAHIAAMYLDAGIDNTRKYLFSVYGDRLSNAVENGQHIDYKTKLQEKLQENGPCDISYNLVRADGPVHHCLFEMQVTLNGKVLGSGSAYSKKEAQQRAAENALTKLV